MRRDGKGVQRTPVLETEHDPKVLIALREKSIAVDLMLSMEVGVMLAARKGRCPREANTRPTAMP
jgi:hypothetical protein